MPIARGTFAMSGNKNRVTAAAIETAMSQAIMANLGKNSDEVRAAMLAARKRVLEDVQFHSKGGRVIISMNTIQEHTSADDDEAMQEIKQAHTRSLIQRLMFWRKLREH